MCRWISERICIASVCVCVWIIPDATVNYENSSVWCVSPSIHCPDIPMELTLIVAFELVISDFFQT